MLNKTWFFSDRLGLLCFKVLILSEVVLSFFITNNERTMDRIRAMLLVGSPNAHSNWGGRRH